MTLGPLGHVRQLAEGQQDMGSMGCSLGNAFTMYMKTRPSAWCTLRGGACGGRGGTAAAVVGVPAHCCSVKSAKQHLHALHCAVCTACASHNLLPACLLPTAVAALSRPSAPSSCRLRAPTRCCWPRCSSRAAPSTTCRCVCVGGGRRVLHQQQLRSNSCTISQQQQQQ